MKNMKVKITRTKTGFDDLPLPEYASAGSAGMDVYAALEEPVIVDSGGICLVPTGLAIALESGFECQVRSRSGLALKHGIFALNAPGTIDSDYRGEIKVIIANFGKEKFEIKRGDRISQLVIARYEHIAWDEQKELDATDRGAGGFGSTGLSSNLFEKK
jgi:dUTP pyrophosphatase